MSTIAKDLRKILNSSQVLDMQEDILAYANDATYYIAKKNPDAVAVPFTTEEVAGVVKYAYDNGITVVPRGAGSGLAGGCTPINGGIVLDMKRMNSILEIDSRNMTASVQGGVILETFNKALKKERLFYPPDPQSMKVCTIGGNVATRAGGPRGVKYGTTERYVTGLEVVLPDGSIITPGGKVVKQASGYDLTHLFTGSEGTLGVITGAHLRLLPEPADSRTILVTCSSAEQAAKIVSAIIANGIIPAMLEFLINLAIIVMNNYVKPPMPLTGEAYLLIELDGSTAQVEEETREFERICSGFDVVDLRIVGNRTKSAQYWEARSRLYPMTMSIFKRVITEDVTVPRSSIPELIRRIRAIAAEVGIPIGLAGHAGDGNMHPTILMNEISDEMTKKSDDAIAQIIEACLDLSGTISGEHGIGLHKNMFMEKEHGLAQMDLMKKIKSVIDTKNIMNPGKIWLEEGGR